MVNSSCKPIFAIVVGINEYADEHFPRLQSAVHDAQKLVKFLQEELQVPLENITSLYDGEATKDKIIAAISSLPAKPTFQPDDAVLFFFSGLAGKAPLERAGNAGGGDKDPQPTHVGIICPVDTTASQSGISDSTLIGLFDLISRSHGNNITLLLDCDSNIFNWGDPSSCVVVLPEDATETETGGAFTKSLINVLRAEKELGRIQSLTVRSFANKVQANNNKGPMHYFGRNVDRFLFDRAGGGAYHSFILGRVEVGGDITLTAGAAHGIQPGTKLAIFPSSVKDSWNEKIGNLVVNSVGDTHAILRRPPRDNTWTLPPIFYAVETQYPGEIAQILVKEPRTSAFPEFGFCGTKQVDKGNEANITLISDENKASIRWNGVTQDKEHLRGDYRTGMTSKNLELERKRIRFGRMLRYAARFTYHLSRTSPVDSSLANNLHVELVEYHNDTVSQNNLLSDGCATLKLEREVLGPYCLVIHNRSKDDLWPYVFTFDPGSFCILPWYLPSPGASQPPLEAGKQLTIGRGDDESLLFEPNKSQADEISYIKVFVTREWTDFSSLMQLWKSPTEDRVREATSWPSNAAPTPAVPVPVACENEEDVPSKKKLVAMKLGSVAGWTAVRFAIIRSPKESGSGKGTGV